MLDFEVKDHVGQDHGHFPLPAWESRRLKRLLIGRYSSIVAREYGIPAVMATGVATRRIHNGQTVMVDGTSGTVTLA